jgi:pilus assembly protein CpaD
MMKTAFRSMPKTIGTAITLSLGLALAGCGVTASENRSLESVHQPIVQRTNFTFDAATGPGGLSYSEQQRVANWFESMKVGYGDQISIDDPLRSESTRAAIEAIAGRYGVIVADQAPVTAGYVNAGTSRIVITRSSAHVPGCPNWSTKSDTNLNNSASSNFGCAINSNLAAMVADPEHLVKGADGQSDTVVMSSSKAIDAYRSATPTGTNGLSAQSTQSGK